MNGDPNEWAPMAPVPVWSGDGPGRRIRLARRGKDAGGHRVSAEAIEYREAMPVTAAFAVIHGTLDLWHWAEPAAKSKAAALAGALAIYCAALFPKLTERVPVLISGPARSGKTALMRLLVEPVWGEVPHDRFGDEPEMLAVLDRVAVSRQPVLAFDDTDTIDSSALRLFVAVPVHKLSVDAPCRHHEIKTQVVANGCGLRLAYGPPDVVLSARLDSPAQRREDGELGARRGVVARAQWMAALWALLRNWDEAGRPAGAWLGPEFGPFQRLVGGIIEAAPLGLPSPFEFTPSPSAPRRTPKQTSSLSASDVTPCSRFAASKKKNNHEISKN